MTLPPASVAAEVLSSQTIHCQSAVVSIAQEKGGGGGGGKSEVILGRRAKVMVQPSL